MINLSQYQNTKTILVIRNDEEYKQISNYFGSTFDSNYGTYKEAKRTFCLNMCQDKKFTTCCYLTWYLQESSYKMFTYVEVSSLINKEQIYELWT